MATYTFDDGSTISNNETPTGWTTSATPATDGGVMSWTQDGAEAAKLNQFYPNNSNQQWWQQAAMYGLTRGVDAAFMSATANKTMQPATYAGANGRTYVAGQAGAGAGGGLSPMVLLLIAGALVFAIAD